MADLGRVSLRLWEWGDPAAPPVVMAHGFFDHGRMFDGIAPRVAALGYHVVAVDQRGHGDSSRVSSNNWEGFTIDLALLARRLGPPAVLVGHSFGGGQVLGAASAFPELVTKVVNIDGMGPPPEYLRDDANTLPFWLATAEQIWRQPQREYSSLEEMAARRKEMNPRMPPEWLLHLARHGSRPGPGGGLVWKSDQNLRIRSPGPMREETMQAQYAGIRCPILVLTGAEPDVFSGLAEDVLQARLAVMPDVEHHAVSGAGHFVHLEQPDVVMEHLERFLGAGGGAR
jgi:pimeloyl-ACP methyl ester carboxylesterase